VRGETPGRSVWGLEGWPLVPLALLFQGTSRIGFFSLTDADLFHDIEARESSCFRDLENLVLTEILV
jgi:hypothetical protein